VWQVDDQGVRERRTIEISKEAEPLQCGWSGYSVRITHSITV
jgi:hypothetical protein